jgi:ion channel-forming bestrophin family protein
MDENDLDLDLFVQDVIGRELREMVKHPPFDLRVREGGSEKVTMENGIGWMRKRRKWKVVEEEEEVEGEA